MSISVDVLVPVLHRPWQAASFMKSLDEPRARVCVIAEPDDGDTITAWIQAGAYVLVHPTAHTFAEKINAGFNDTSAPWVLLVGDDARFTPGWLDAALSVTGEVIGTTDEKNPRVVKGSHSCHPMISRKYVEVLGASWDLPGLVCHEGYRHNYVDDEIVDVAKQRGVWVMSPAVIHHLHPVWGTAQNDGTYRHGQESADQDRALYKRRKAVYAR
jgi:hypothetical protein